MFLYFFSILLPSHTRLPPHSLLTCMPVHLVLYASSIAYCTLAAPPTLTASHTDLITQAQQNSNSFCSNKNSRSCASSRVASFPCFLGLYTYIFGDEFVTFWRRNTKVQPARQPKKDSCKNLRKGINARHSELHP